MTDTRLSAEQAAGKIMVALDYPAAAAAEQLLQQLSGIPCYVKVGMELFYSEGPPLIASLKSRGYRVFLDLKLHDIPNTVGRAAAVLTRLGVDMFNVHAAGGLKMMAAAREGMEQAASGQTPLLIAVTQLTSTSEQVMNEEIGIAGPLEQAVEAYAKLAQQAGLNGVVSSAHEVERIKAACGSQFVTVTPGIRPSYAAHGDQTRVMTPREALEAGTDFMVIGRAITAAPDPRQAVEMIIEELTR